VESELVDVTSPSVFLFFLRWDEPESDFSSESFEELFPLYEDIRGGGGGLGSDCCEMMGGGGVLGVMSSSAGGDAGGGGGVVHSSIASPPPQTSSSGCVGYSHCVSPLTVLR